MGRLLLELALKHSHGAAQLPAPTTDIQRAAGATSRAQRAHCCVFLTCPPAVCVCSDAFRWVKFEEKVEEGGERWSKPHVSTLSLHSLFELRTCLQTGTVLLDLEGYSLPQIVGESSAVTVSVCSDFNQ